VTQQLEVAGRVRQVFTRGRIGQLLVVGIALIVIAWLALVPLARLLHGTFVEDGSFTFDAFSRAYASFPLEALIRNSLVFSIGATLVAVVIGTALAYITERTDTPMRSLIFVAALAPFIFPGILYNIAWVFIGSPRLGLINTIFSPFVDSPVFNVFTMFGLIVVEGLSNAPIAFLLMMAAFRAMDPSLEESAVMSGARLSTVLRRITLPLVVPAIAAAALLLMVASIASFETPAVLGIPGDIWVFTSRIYRVLGQFPVDYGQAGAYGVSLVILCTLGILAYNRLTSSGKRYQTISGKGFRPRRVQLGRWRWPVALATFVYFGISVLLPLFMLLWISLQPFTRMPSVDALGSLTLDNYRVVFEDDLVVRSFWNSALLGVGSATVVMLLTAVAAWVVVKTRLRGRWLLDNLTFIPLVFPGLVLGLALLFVYLRSPIQGIYGTLWILLIAYCTRFMPIGMRYAVASMFQLSSELEESAQASGATWGQTLRRVVIPLIAPGLLAGWVFVLIVGIRELSTSILLYSSGTEVLSITVWELYETGQYGALTALGVLMIAVLVTIVALAQILARRIGVGGINAV
jgi:iron(III) transport system permease protein